MGSHIQCHTISNTLCFLYLFIFSGLILPCKSVCGLLSVPPGEPLRCQKSPLIISKVNPPLAPITPPQRPTPLLLKQLKSISSALRTAGLNPRRLSHDPAQTVGSRSTRTHFLPSTSFLTSSSCLHLFSLYNLFAANPSATQTHTAEVTRAGQ